MGGCGCDCMGEEALIAASNSYMYVCVGGEGSACVGGWVVGCDCVGVGVIVWVGVGVIAWVRKRYSLCS